MPRKNPNYSTKRVKPSPLPTPARSIFPSSSTSAPTPIAQRNRQVSTGIGYTRDGWVLEGRQPGCVLRRELSAETLGHILIEDNLLVLGIPVNPERKRNQSDSEGGGGGKKGGTTKTRSLYKPASSTEGSFDGVMANLKLSAVRSRGSVGGKKGSWSAPASAMGSFGADGVGDVGKGEGKGEGKEEEEEGGVEDGVAKGDEGEGVEAAESDGEADRNGHEA